jgi:type IV pilus assembly protein PilA
MTTLNSKLQLALIKRKKGKNLLQKGFTLVELMIVIVIVGVLSAVALPNFLGTKNKAEAQSVIGAMAAQAKLCGANVIIGDAAALTAVAGVKVTGTCDGAQNAAPEITNESAFPDATKIGGVNCGGAKHTGASDGGTTCTLTVDQTTGSFTGAWS